MTASLRTSAPRKATRQRVSLRDAKVQAAYLRAYRATGFHTLAAVAVAVTPAAAACHRRIDPALRSACAAIDQARDAPVPRAPFRRWTAARSVVFLAALAANGSVQAAADHAGLTVPNVYKRRVENADFAADWAMARNRALDRVEDMLFTGIFNGFKRTETVGDVVKTVIVQRPDAMFRLLGTRRNADRPGVRTLELTPALLASARAKLERQLRLAAASGNADAAIAALPLAALPAPAGSPGTALALVPPVTVPAR
ncbi:hypothetical protein KX816_14920 [Sphingosinicellaceae bacterium]|nr:hypothetical protein KX816_14920 [Sphingosinicellaceae bacterium]